MGGWVRGGKGVRVRVRITCMREEVQGQRHKERDKREVERDKEKQKLIEGVYDGLLLLGERPLPAGAG